MGELISDEVMEKTKTLEDLYKLMPPEFNTFYEYRQQLDYFEYVLNNEYPEFTADEIINIHENYDKVKDILSWPSVSLLLAGIKFKQHKKNIRIVNIIIVMASIIIIAFIIIVLNNNK